MNEMYDMSIVTHNFGVYGVLGVILVHVIMLYTAKDLFKYRIFMTLFLPIASTTIGAVIFTGVIMMAAKHLDFTIENIIMILFAVIFLVLEVKKSSTLKKLSSKKKDGFAKYKIYAYKILLAEFVMVLAISAWMWA